MRRGYVDSVRVQDGSVLCTVEDADRPGTIYPDRPVIRPMMQEIVVPKPGTEVVLETMRDGELFVTGVVSTPGKTGPALEEGELGFVFPNDKDDTNPDSIVLTRDSSGDYTITVDLGGDVTIKADGTVTVDSNDVKLGGSGGKKVARDNDSVTASDPLTGPITGNVNASSSTTESN
jgi:hypothetical protein